MFDYVALKDFYPGREQRVALAGQLRKLVSPISSVIFKTRRGGETLSAMTDEIRQKRVRHLSSSPSAESCWGGSCHSNYGTSCRCFMWRSSVLQLGHTWTRQEGQWVQSDSPILAFNSFSNLDISFLQHADDDVAAKLKKNEPYNNICKPRVHTATVAVQHSAETSCRILFPFQKLSGNVIL